MFAIGRFSAPQNRYIRQNRTADAQDGEANPCLSVLAVDVNLRSLDVLEASELSVRDRPLRRHVSRHRLRFA
jgi:hypothetical protein